MIQPTTLILTIERINPQSITVSIGGDNKCFLLKECIEYDEDELVVGAEIEITLSEKYAINKGLV